MESEMQALKNPDMKNDFHEVRMIFMIFE